LHLAVRDDGVGFDPESTVEAGHYGLRLVQETVADAGGRLTVDSAPGHGTSVQGYLPL